MPRIHAQYIRDGRMDVSQLHRRVDHLPGILTRQVHEQRNADDVLVKVVMIDYSVSAKAFAVVRGNNDDGIAVERLRLQVP